MQADNAAPAMDSKRTIFQLCWQFLVRYRIRISLIVFIALIAEDVLEGLRPHNLLNSHDWISVLGLVFIVSGLGLRSWAAGILHKTSKLTTSGPYSLVRHPLYVGPFLMMIGFCLLIDDAENIWFVLGPFALIYFVKLINEERVLSQKFGDQWQEYAGRVSRFFPSQWPKNTLAPWCAGQWLGNREYNALGATAVGLVVIQL